MLQVPKDPHFKIPEQSDEDFLNTANSKYDEDVTLLATGAWDDEPDESDEINEK